MSRKISVGVRVPVDNKIEPTTNFHPSCFDQHQLQQNSLRPKFDSTMSQDLIRRPSRSNLATNRKENVRKLDKLAREWGFTSLFEAALEEADFEWSDAIAQFVERDGFEKVYSIYRRRYRKPKTDREVSEINESICRPAVQIYGSEWKTLAADASLKCPSREFDPNALSDFSFSTYLTKFKQHIPNLYRLLCSLAPVDSRPEAKKRDQKSQDRVIATTVSILASFANRFTALQHLIGVFLYGRHVSVDVLTFLNHLGLCPSYMTIRSLLEVVATHQIKRLTMICLNGEAIMISYDNCNLRAAIRDLRMMNQGGMSIFTVGFAATLHKLTGLGMLKRSDRNFNRLANVDLDRLNEVTILDFMPTSHDRARATESVCFFIYNILKKLVDAKGIEIAKLDYSYPSEYRLDPKAVPDIIPLPAMDLDEGKTSDMIKIIQRVIKVIGISERQRKENIVFFKGDLMTVLNDRYCKIAAKRLTSTGAHSSAHARKIRKRGSIS